MSAVHSLIRARGIGALELAFVPKFSAEYAVGRTFPVFYPPTCASALFIACIRQILEFHDRHRSTPHREVLYALLHYFAPVRFISVAHYHSWQDHHDMCSGTWRAACYPPDVGCSNRSRSLSTRIQFGEHLRHDPFRIRPIRHFSRSVWTLASTLLASRTNSSFAARNSLNNSRSDSPNSGSLCALGFR